MAIPFFPSYAVLLADNYAEDVDPQLRRTEMDDGTAKQAPLRSRVTATRDVTFLIPSGAQYRDWRAFWFDELGQGASWFMWRDPADLTWKRARIRGGTFKATPVENAAEYGQAIGSNAWRVRFAIETADVFSPQALNA